MLQQIDLVLAAAPFRDLWFSTVHSMTSRSTPPPFEHFRSSELLSIFGRRINRGDLLSSDGTVVKTRRQLLGRLHPVEDGGTPADELGLDAVFLWPSGEVWFSTEKGFQDSVLGPVRGGDLLSDGGYVVFGNMHLISAFSPLEDLADFGLDALVVVSDTLAPLRSPAVTGFALMPIDSGWRLEWTGVGRFFQVLDAPTAAGSCTPVAQIQTDLFLERDGLLSIHPEYFFEVRQW